MRDTFKQWNLSPMDMESRRLFGLLCCRHRLLLFNFLQALTLNTTVSLAARANKSAFS